MSRTNGLANSLPYDSMGEYLKKKKICNNYQKNSAIRNDRPEETKPEVSVSFAAGIKFSFKEKSGFSMQILTPEEISKEHIRSTSVPGNIDVTPRKGAGVNIYC